MFEAILPKRRLIDTGSIKSRARNELASFALDAWRMAAAYEAPPVPSYIRRGAEGGLKSSWSKRGPSDVKGSLEVAVVSSGETTPYNVWVRGPHRPKAGQRGQARAMRSRGWMSITDIVNKLWPKRAARLRRILRGK